MSDKSMDITRATPTTAHVTTEANDRRSDRRSFESLSFEGNNIRTVIQDGEPWLAGADVCKALGIANPTRGLAALDEDEKMTLHLMKGHCASQRGGARSLTFVNEPGAWRLTMRSDKPKARAFTRWLAHEVIPAIRRTGHYMISGAKNAEAAACIWDTTIGTDGVHVLRELVTKKVRVLPTGVQRSARLTLWNSLHARFNVARAELIPAEKMDSAANFLAAYVYEGAVEDKPTHTMEPVVFTVPRQIGRPESSGAPRNDITLQKIFSELLNWGDANLPRGEVQDSFCNAVQTAANLQVSCWTEIDEALLRLTQARGYVEDGIRFLNRWQGRGGRIGNVG